MRWKIVVAGMLFILFLEGCSEKSNEEFTNSVVEGTEKFANDVVDGDGYKGVYPPGWFEKDEKTPVYNEDEGTDDSIIGRIEKKIWGD